MNNYIDRVIARLKIGWTRNSQSRNSSGEQVTKNNRDATRWCLVAAMNIENDNKYDECFYNLFAKIGKLTGYRLLSYYNDYIAKSVDDVISTLEQCKE